MRARFGLAVLAVGVLAVLGAPAVAATSGWNIALSPVPRGTARSAPGDVSCPSAHLCFRVSYSIEVPTTPFVVVSRDARISAHVLPLPTDAARPATGSEIINAIDCVSASYCVAVGSYTASDGRVRPLIETYRGGTWRASAAPWPAGASHLGPKLLDVACNPASCVATGDYFDSGMDLSTGFLAVRTGSKGWTDPDLLDPLFAASVGHPACTPRGPCYAQSTGFDFDLGYQVSRLLYPSAGGWAGANFPTPAGADPGTLQVGTMACPSQDFCTGVAAYRDQSPKRRQHLAAEQLTFGRLSAREIAISARAAGRADDLVAGPTSCGSVSAGVPCAAAATVNQPDSGHALLLTRTAGRWHVSRAPTPADGDAGSVRIHDISCPDGGRCAAVGDYDVDRRALPLAERWNGHEWTATGFGVPAGASGEVAQFDAVSCAPSQVCMASGTAPRAGQHPNLIYARYGS